MSKSEREKQRMAYLDGQLTAGEAAAFDASLTEEERRCLAAEMRLEEGIAERLRDDIPCPEALWNSLRSEMAAVPASKRSRLPLIAGLALAATAALTVGAALLYSTLNPIAPTVALASSAAPAQEIAEDIRTTLEMAGRTLVPAQQQSIEQFLEAHDIRLAVNCAPKSLSKSGHKARLLGACLGNCPQGSIVEVLIDYDGKPAKLLLAKVGGHGARIIENALAKGEVVQTRHLDDYIAGVVVCRRIASEDADHVAMLFDFIQPLNDRIAGRELPKPAGHKLPMQHAAAESPRDSHLNVSTQRIAKTFV